MEEVEETSTSIWIPPWHFQSKDTATTYVRTNPLSVYLLTWFCQCKAYHQAHFSRRFDLLLQIVSRHEWARSTLANDLRWDTNVAIALGQATPSRNESSSQCTLKRQKGLMSSWIRPVGWIAHPTRAILLAKTIAGPLRGTGIWPPIIDNICCSCRSSRNVWWTHQNSGSVRHPLVTKCNPVYLHEDPDMLQFSLKQNAGTLSELWRQHEAPLANPSV